MSANCVRIPSSKRPAKVHRVASSSTENRNQLGRNDQTLRVPPGKIIKAQAMLVQGRSQREIGRELHMSGHSVAKIIRSEDFQNFIREQRERLFAIAPVALESFRARVKADGNLAYTFLKDLAIIPSREAMVNMMTSPTEQAETGMERQARMIANLMLEGHANFGIAFPKDVEEALAKDAQEYPGAKTSQLKPPK